MSVPLDDQPDQLLENARLRLRAEQAEADTNREGVRLARRIFTAFVLLLLMGVVCFVVLPTYGVWLPPQVIVLSFAVILVGAVMSFVGDHPGASQKPTDPPTTDEGRPIGCCSGPRPLRCFRDDHK